MFVLKILFKNAFRHKLRTSLTVLGITIAVLAFGLLRTVVGAWYAGVEASSATRLVTRNAVSLVFFLPLSYREKIRQVPGVTEVGYSYWFAGVYKEEKNFFPNFATDAKSALDLYPEFIVPRNQEDAFLRDRRGAVVGRKTAERFGWKIGDIVTLKGTIFPGNWEFVIRAIYRGAQKSTDETQFFFHWNYLNESLKKTASYRADRVGWFLVGVKSPDAAADVAVAIDKMFLHRDRHHHGGDGQHHGDDREGADRRVCDHEDAGLRRMAYRGAHIRRVARDCGDRLRTRHRPHLSGGRGLWRFSQPVLPGLHRRQEHDLHGYGGRADRCDRLRRLPCMAGDLPENRRRTQEDRLMAIPVSYSFRNLWTRRLTTILTASGMALVVFVFASVMMLAEGLRQTLVETGSYDNVVVIRKASQSEMQSGIDRASASIVETEPEIAIGTDGRPFLAKELVVIINLPKRGSDKPSNITIRGIGEYSLALRPQVKLVEGRMPKSGASEIIAGQSVAKRFRGAGIGETIRFAMRDWTVVGIFDAGRTGYSSEIWGDVDQLMQAFRRPAFSSVLFKLRASSEFQKVKERIENDPRLTLEAKRETKYYADQSEMMAKFLRILGITLTIIFSLGAVIGATITMYAAVATRTAEIGTLRSLGFQRRNILAAFLLESMFLGLSGGLLGLFFASFMQLITISTVNWQTFSELAFSFTLTRGIIINSLLFSVVMGLAGGVLPAVRASRMNIVDALRTS
jgi:putative ABC transport system permease protein